MKKKTQVQADKQKVGAVPRKRSCASLGIILGIVLGSSTSFHCPARLFSAAGRVYENS